MGTILPTFTDANNTPPRKVEGVLVLTQALDGLIETSSYTSRGYYTAQVTNRLGNSANTSTVEVGSTAFDLDLPSGQASE